MKFFLTMSARSICTSGLAWGHLRRAFGIALLTMLCNMSKTAIAQATGAQTIKDGSVIAAKPPMGWNSWDSYGLRINEQQFRDNVDVLNSKLKPFGYTYAVIDEGWFMQNPEERPHPEQLQYAIDSNGRYIPVPSRFPSALAGEKNIGFQKIAEQIHSQGLKFGIHIVRGIPRESVKRDLPIEGSSYKVIDAADQTDACPWDPTNWGVKDNEAGQAWYDSLLHQYATWGVDFLKVDCISDHPYKQSEIKQIRLAIQRSGRDIVLSLSPGPTKLERAVEVGSLAQMWRISNDIWDVWYTKAPFPDSIKNQFALAAAWAQYAKPGNWPDADMLPLGELRPYPDVGPGPRHTALTPAEQQTMLSLWAFARSPLILGANLTLLDDATYKLLTNSSILKIDQTAIASREAAHEGDVIFWTADLPGNSHALAIFNIGDTSVNIEKKFSDLGLPAGKLKIQNAWKEAAKASADSVKDTIVPHGSLVLILGSH